MLCTSLTLTVLYTSTITYNAYLCTSLTLTVLYTSTITYNAYLCRPLALTILYTSTVWLCTNIPVYIYVLPNSGCVLLCLNANIFVHKHQFLIYIYRLLSPAYFTCWQVERPGWCFVYVTTYNLPQCTSGPCDISYTILKRWPESSKNASWTN